MRRALIIAIVGVVLGALALAGVGTFLVANAGARADSARELGQQARRVADEVPAILDAPTAKLRVDLVRVVKATVGAEFVTVVPGSSPVAVDRKPSIVGSALPAALTVAQLHLPRLLHGSVVSGTSGNEVFAAVALAGIAPDQIRHPGVRRRTAASAAATGTVVLILTRAFRGAGLGGGYLALVSGGTLIVAAAVALVLSRRITRPLHQAVEATGRIASGDLSVRVPDEPGHYPELASLVQSINTMAGALARSAAQEQQFLLSISHDLRTPLTSILGYAEAIADGATDDPPGAAGVIASEARRLARLVQDLLDLARLDAHQFSLHLAPVDLRPVLVSSVDGVRHRLVATGLAARMSVPDDGSLRVLVDPDRTSQILSNLLDNACKFAHSAIELTAHRNGDGSVVVTVTDDGPGIDAEHLAHVFERQYQVPASRAAPVGSGLGLAIAAELAAAMGGRIRAMSPAATEHIRPPGPPALPGTGIEEPPPLLGASGAEASERREPGPGTCFELWFPAPGPTPDPAHF